MANITSSWMDKRQTPGLYWDPRHHGLGVRVFRDGTTKSWQFQKGGKNRSTLGRWPTMNVAEARRIAAEYNETGVPKREDEWTFARAHEVWADDFLERGGSPKTVAENEGRVRKHTDWWDRTVADTQRIDLIALRTDIKKRAGVHPARDTTGHLKRLVELVTGERFLLPHLPRPQSDRAARSGRLEEWWPAVTAASSPRMLDAHSVCVLTGLRQSEVLGLRRSLVSGDTIRIPNPKAKMGKDLSFDRHLPEQVRTILSRQMTNGDRFFPFNKIRTNDGSWAHQCRHAFIGIAESETAVPRRVMRALVNHTGKSDVTDGYGTPSSEALASWSQNIADIIGEKIGL